MANIQLASNSVAHFPGTTVSNAVGTFNADRVPYSIAVNSHLKIDSPEFTPVAGGTTWFHFKTRSGGAKYGKNYNWFDIHSSSGQVLVRLGKINSFDHYVTMRLYDGTTSSVVNLGVFPTGVLKQVDIKVVVNNLEISCEFYLEGTLLGQLSFGANPNSLLTPNKFSIYAGLVNDSNADIQYWSELLVSDQDTRNAVVHMLRPISSGAYNEFSGLIATLADDDPITGMTALAGGLKQTVGLTAYSGSAIISNVVAVSTTMRGINSPTGMKHIIRLSGVDYKGAVTPIPFSKKTSYTDYTLNPATSLNWDGSDMGLIEAGFETVT